MITAFVFLMKNYGDDGKVEKWKVEKKKRGKVSGIGREFRVH